MDNQFFLKKKRVFKFMLTKVNARYSSSPVFTIAQTNFRN